MTKRTSIDPADIRVGDLVERRCTYPDGVTKTRVRGVIAEVDTPFGSPMRIRIADMWSGRKPGSTVTWYLLDRPDPDKALIEAAARLAFEEANRAPWQPAIPAVKEQWRQIASATLAAIRETHDVVPRGEK